MLFYKVYFDNTTKTVTNSSEWLGLFNEANNLITEIRLTTDKSTIQNYTV